MGTKEAYKQKIEAEVELAQAKLAELKAQSKNSAADATIEYASLIEKLEKEVTVIKARLKESDGGNWEQFKDGVETVWGKVSAAVRDTAAKFKN